jgi:DNA end-binding protein Ku
MRFADELVDVSQFELPGSKDVRKPELDMARALVDSLAAEWDPSKYTDQYRENLMRIVKSKVEGEEPELEAEETPRSGEVVDLMERLRRSLAHAGGTPHRATAAKPAKKTHRKKRARHAA